MSVFHVFVKLVQNLDIYRVRITFAQTHPTEHLNKQKTEFSSESWSQFAAAWEKMVCCGMSVYYHHYHGHLSILSVMTRNPGYSISCCWTGEQACEVCATRYSSGTQWTSNGTS